MEYVRQINDYVPIYTQQDVCVICGRYMPEGTGMVCRDCMAAVDERYIAHKEQEG